MKNELKPGKAITPHSWTKAEAAVFQKLTSPFKIQEYLDTIPYSADPFYRSPRSVLRDRKAHCFDGALFAAAALRQIGYPPLILDILAERDDDHLLALFKRNGHWGSIAKSNFSGLRFREPVFKTLRELVLSYFEDYYNSDAEKTMRGYTVPLKLARFDVHSWMTEDDHLELVADQLDKIRSVKLFSKKMIGEFSLLDRRSYDAGMLGVNKAGLYHPKPKNG